MSEQWYLRHQGNEVGPLAEEKLLQMAADSQVAPSAEIRKAGTTRWVTATRVKGLFPDSLGAPPVAEPPAGIAAPPPLPAGDTEAPNLDDQGNSLWDDLDLDELNQIPTSVSQPVTSAARPADSRKPAAAGHRKRWLVISGAGLSLVVATVAILVLAGSGDVGMSQREPDRQDSQVSPPDPSVTGVFPTLPVDNSDTNPLQPALADWRELRAGSGTRLGNLSIVVDHLWVQPTLSPVPADKPDELETNTATVEEPDVSESPAERFLFIKFTFRTGDTGFRYSSWNGTGPLGARVSANLTDAEETLLTLVPLDKTPTEPRQASVDLDARSVASDVLVFTLPATVSGEIRLQLPQEALGLRGPPLRFSISPKVLASSRRPQTAPSNTLAGTAVSEPLDATTSPAENGEQPGSATDLLRTINRPATSTDVPPQQERARPATSPKPSAPLDKPAKKSAPAKAKQKKPAAKPKSKRKSKSPRKPRIESKFNPF